jgi:hypothetical protein
MSLKIATLTAIIGQGLYLLWLIALNLNLLQWNRVIGVILNIIGIGSILVFLVTLYVKQTK